MNFELVRPSHGVYTNFVWALDGKTQSMRVDGGRIVDRFDGHCDLPEAIDLNRRHVAPAFVDAHCHILPGGLDLQKLSLIACESHEAVLDAVRDRHASLEPGRWLMAVHYDQTKYAGGAHLTKAELDTISTERPILLRHSNGHASVANSAALRLAGVGPDAQDPKGGTFVRGADGAPNGVLLELAHERVTAAAPTPTLEQMVDAILAACRRMEAFGIVEATDMMTGRYNLPLELQAYRIAAERGNPVRVRLCIQWAERLGPRAKPVDEELSALDGDRVAVWGVKIFADGAIGSATAAIRGSFDSDHESQGTLIYAPDRLSSMIRKADEAGLRVAVHSIGDRSTDHVMDAYEQLSDASRHRIEHAMLMDDAQIERMARLGVHCSMQPEFLQKFGRSYRHHLGAERASRLNRYRSVKDAGIPLSLSSDFPIVSGDPWLGIAAATCRPEGFVQDENLTLEEAVAGYSVMGSVANGGSAALRPGDPAEFLTFDPLRVM